MKGIILAGGTGSRLHPITLGVSKQLMPIYDKTIIYYPLSGLILEGIREILIITTDEDQSSFKKLLGNGKHLGINLQYCIQKKPNGIAEAFIIGREFIGKDSVCLILGDNIFYGDRFSQYLKRAIKSLENNYATIFGYYVTNPEQYGVIEMSESGDIERIIEKPFKTKSNYAATGLYFYPNDVVKISETITPSNRGELEITSINNHYLKTDRLTTELLGRGYLWLDTGTHDSLNSASNLIKEIQTRQGSKIACLEEIALNNKWISNSEIDELVSNYKNRDNVYFDYVIKLVNTEKS